MKLNHEEMLGCVLGHTDHMEVGELEYSEWAAKLIEDQGHTVAGLIAYAQAHCNWYSNSDFQALRDLKNNFPQYNI